MPFNQPKVFKGNGSFFEEGSVGLSRLKGENISVPSHPVFGFKNPDKLTTKKLKHSSFRIICFNVHNWSSFVQRDQNERYLNPKLALNFINENFANPDMLVFQENGLFLTDSTINQLNSSNSYGTSFASETILKLFGLDKKIFTCDHLDAGTHGFTFVGKAIYTNKMDNVRYYNLDNLSANRTDGPRNALCITYPNFLNEQNLRLYNIQLSTNRDQELQEKQLMSLNELLRSENLDYPLQIVMGDFNTPLKQRDEQNTHILPELLSLTSGGDYINFSPTHATEPKSNFIIDGCFVSKQFNEKFTITCNSYHSNVSDHYPLCIDIQKR